MVGKWPVVPAGLNEKQRLFCAEYLKDFNATAAAIRAGYSHHKASMVGSQLRRDPQIADYLAQCVELKAQKAEIDADYVLQGIKRVTEACAQLIPLFDKNGSAIMVEAESGELVPVCVPADAANSHKGYELLGKTLALFTDRTELASDKPIELIHSAMDSETAARKYKELMER